MVSSAQIIRDLTDFYKDNVGNGLIVVATRLSELEAVVESDRLIFSSIEDNQFRWQDEGRTKADWFSIWIRVKNNLLDIQAGKRPGGNGVFRFNFNNIQP